MAVADLVVVAGMLGSRFLVMRSIFLRETDVLSLLCILDRHLLLDVYRCCEA